MNKVRLDIYDHNGIIIARTDEILNTLSWSNELMYTPQVSIELPIKYLDLISGREEVKLYVNDKVFWGIIMGISPDKESETVTLTVKHVVHEWTYRQISVNNAVQDQLVNIVYEDIEEKPTYEEFTVLEYIEARFDFLQKQIDIGTITDSDRERYASILAEYKKFKDSEYTDYEWVTILYENGYVTADWYNQWIADNPDALIITDEEGGHKYLDGSPCEKVPNTTWDDPKKYREVITCAYTYWPDDSLTGEARIKAIKENSYLKAWVRDLDTNEKTDITADILVEEGPIDEVKDNPNTDPDESIESLDEYGIRFTSPHGTVLETNKTVYPNGTATVEDELEDIYEDKNFAYPGWNMNFDDEAGKTSINYVYSRQNKLDALTKTMELTPDLFWRVRFTNSKTIDISDFGDTKNLMISKRKYLLKEPDITYDFSNVVNVATVYSEKVDTGVSSMTLREVYADPSLQIAGFPVVILRANVNNERDYTKYINIYPKLAPNEQLEYAIIDEESVAMEGGILVEGTYAFNDLAPFEADTDEDTGEELPITDQDRIDAATTAYHAAIKKLKNARRSYQIQITCEELPYTFDVGDKVRFVYDNSIYNLSQCSNYWRKILTYNDWFYVTKVTYRVQTNGFETDTITLEKILKIDRDTSEST